MSAARSVVSTTRSRRRQAARRPLIGDGGHGHGAQAGSGGEPARRPGRQSAAPPGRRRPSERRGGVGTASRARHGPPGLARAARLRGFYDGSTRRCAIRPARAAKTSRDADYFCFTPPEQRPRAPFRMRSRREPPPAVAPALTLFSGCYASGVRSGGRHRCETFRAPRRCCGRRGRRRRLAGRRRAAGAGAGRSRAGERQGHHRERARPGGPGRGRHRRPHRGRGRDRRHQGAHRRRPRR